MPDGSCCPLPGDKRTVAGQTYHVRLQANQVFLINYSVGLSHIVCSRSERVNIQKSYGVLWGNSFYLCKSMYMHIGIVGCMCAHLLYLMCLCICV